MMSVPERSPSPVVGPARDDTSLGYVQFDILSEPWDRYRLSDGTVLRLRFVLFKIKRAAVPTGAEQGLQSVSMVSQTIVVTEAPESLRGPPGAPVLPPEYQSHIDQEVNFQPEFVAPSIYRFDGSRVVTVSPSLVRVHRLRDFGPDGDRQYFVESAASVTIVSMPATPAPAAVQSGNQGA